MTDSIEKIDWNALKEDCKLVHSCPNYAVSYAVKRKDRKAQRQLEAKQRDIENVTSAAKASLEADPNQTKEQLTGSILATLLPWVLPFMRDWMVSTFQRLVIDWLVNRLKPAPD